MENYGFAAHMGTRIHLYSLLVLLAAAALCVVLEVWLARREKRWPGLILPGAACLWALIEAACFFAGLRQRFAGALGFALLVLLRDIVPAAVLLAVYALCRELRRRKRLRERDKMQIDDI
nr:hypothetical protein [uncultured Oscillibacter sp.]